MTTRAASSMSPRTHLRLDENGRQVTRLHNDGTKSERLRLHFTRQPPQTATLDVQLTDQILLPAVENCHFYK